MTPFDGAGNSTVALSLSISTITSSADTASPTFFFQTPIITSVIDNLLKGAGGQAVQNLNLMMGWDEAEGLR